MTKRRYTPRKMVYVKQGTTNTLHKLLQEEYTLSAFLRACVIECRDHKTTWKRIQRTMQDN